MKQLMEFATSQMYIITCLESAVGTFQTFSNCSTSVPNLTS